MDDDPRQMYGTKTLCRCPKCRRDHQAKINWTGRPGKPPVFCQSCRENIARSDYSECPIWSVPARAIEFAA